MNYRTYDYSQKSINDIEENDIYNFKTISNKTIGELCKGKNNNLLFFPENLNKYGDNIADNIILSIDEKELRTNDLLGFIGINDSQLTISSRFSKEDTEDYFLHYMLQKIFSINLLNLQHSTSDTNVFDFLAYMFPFFLKRALRQGLYKQYVRKHNNDANVKGVINISENIKRNTPFSGKISYTTREYNYNNDLNQLIRHTIEHIKESHMSFVLSTDKDTSFYISEICQITPTFNKKELNLILNRNTKPLCHPYFTEYRYLQKLCIQILQHKKIKYGSDKNKIYGLIFSASWIWEEFLYKTILKELEFKHPKNKLREGGIYLFKTIGNQSNLDKYIRYPDFYKDNIILDAKYKSLDINKVDRDDMHQIISYMYVEKSKIGGFIYPSTNSNSITQLGELRGYGGDIYRIGVGIPQKCVSYAEYCKLMDMNIIALQGDLTQILI